MDISSLNQQMEEAYEMIKAWARNLQVDDRRNQDDICDYYRQLREIHQEVRSFFVRPASANHPAG